MGIDYDSLFSLDNIFLSWNKFYSGKADKKDVMLFESNLAENLLDLHKDLLNGSYRHGDYDYFKVYDPKKRDIHKAQVRDRIVHQIIFDYLSIICEPDFIANSYASRVGKGMHQAVYKLQYFLKKTLANNRNCWVLKCDIRKYFCSIDKSVLLRLIGIRTTDARILELIREIIFSYKREIAGIPLGNITSQIFANIYLNELDRLIKFELGINEYIRYNDDFIIVGDSKKRLRELSELMRDWLANTLKLILPPEKISIRKAGQGVDFLGYVVFSHHIILRPKTKRRMLRLVNARNLPSYLGLLSHCRSYNLRLEIITLAGQRPVCL